MNVVWDTLVEEYRSQVFLHKLNVFSQWNVNEAQFTGIFMLFCTLEISWSFHYPIVGQSL